jgi:hypothetical protein
MICVIKLKNKFENQLNLFLDINNLDILIYGNAKKIESYFDEIFIGGFRIDDSDLIRKGWDYIVFPSHDDGNIDTVTRSKEIYLIIDTEANHTNDAPHILTFDHKIVNLQGFVKYLKKYIRKDLLGKILEVE